MSKEQNLKIFFIFLRCDWVFRTKQLYSISLGSTYHLYSSNNRVLIRSLSRLPVNLTPELTRHNTRAVLPLKLCLLWLTTFGQTGILNWKWSNVPLKWLYHRWHALYMRHAHIWICPTLTREPLNCFFEWTINS